MKNTGAKNPKTMENDTTVGTIAWNNVNNVRVSDDLYASAGFPLPAFTPTENSLRIVKNGIISGDEKIPGKGGGASLPTSDAYVSYGGSSDLWGLSWTINDINASDFGVVFSVVHSADVTNYLKATNFNFGLSSPSTILGILVEIEQSRSTSFGSRSASIDHIRITVYYVRPWFGGIGENERMKNVKPIGTKLFHSRHLVKK